jgi:hypothetical protein
MWQLNILVIIVACLRILTFFSSSSSSSPPFALLSMYVNDTPRNRKFIGKLMVVNLDKTFPAF